MSDFIHRFIASPNGSDLTVLALHGTGADENDLVELVNVIEPSVGYLSPRGKSNAEGVNRYFKRFSEGVFDVEDIKFRANELGDWVEWAIKQYEIKNLVALGYSNGANVGAALLFARPELLRGLIALRAMTPYEPERLDLHGKRVLMINGETDPLMPKKNADRLGKIFEEAGAVVRHEWLEAGHGLTPDDVRIANEWLAQDFGP